MENTGALTATRDGAGSWWTSENPKSARASPSMTRVATWTSGMPTALLTNGTVRLARRLASKTYRRVPSYTNWMFKNPCTFSARASRTVLTTMAAATPSERCCAGKRAMLSPECTPARSTCSMIPGISTDVPSEIASTSTSSPSTYRSINTGCAGSRASASATNTRTRSAVSAISMPCPPST